jgi:hypothetical protein
VSSVEEDHEFIGCVLSLQGWLLYKAHSLESALSFLCNRLVPVVITERDLPQGNWKDLLAAAQRLPCVPLVIVTDRLADDHLRGRC